MNWWQKRQQTDYFVKKRKEKGVVSRAYFKIEEIYEKFNLSSRKILEIGAAPGGWTQYITRKCHSIVAIDIQSIEVTIPNMTFIKTDIRAFKTEEKFDTILSDIAPNICGNLLIDNAFMEEMIELYCFFSINNLKEKGTLVFKSFQWECHELVLQTIKPLFKSIKVFKPQSSRSSSPEIYVICQNKNAT